MPVCVCVWFELLCQCVCVCVSYVDRVCNTDLHLYVLVFSQFIGCSVLTTQRTSRGRLDIVIGRVFWIFCGRRVCMCVCVCVLDCSVAVTVSYLQY